MRWCCPHEKMKGVSGSAARRRAGVVETATRREAPVRCWWMKTAPAGGGDHATRRVPGVAGARVSQDRWGRALDPGGETGVRCAGGAVDGAFCSRAGREGECTGTCGRRRWGWSCMPPRCVMRLALCRQVSDVGIFHLAFRVKGGVV